MGAITPIFFAELKGNNLNFKKPFINFLKIQRIRMQNEKLYPDNWLSTTDREIILIFKV